MTICNLVLCRQLKVLVLAKHSLISVLNLMEGFSNPITNVRNSENLLNLVCLKLSQSHKFPQHKRNKTRWNKLAHRSSKFKPLLIINWLKILKTLDSQMWKIRVKLSKIRKGSMLHSKAKLRKPKQKYSKLKTRLT